MIIMPLMLLVKMATPRLVAGDPATNALKLPLSPQCQNVRPRGVSSRPIPSPHEIVSDSFVGGRSMQLRHPASVGDWGVSMRRAVSDLRPVPFITAITNRA